MEFEQQLKEIKQCLGHLNTNAKHAIKLKETFIFPAFDKEYHKSINGTNKVYCAKICLSAIYFDFIMTIMRMFDNTKFNNECFEKIFEYLSDDFVMELENNIEKEVKSEIKDALEKYKVLKESHYFGRLKKIRHELFAHTTPDLNKHQIAKHGHAEDLLEKTLPMLNQLNLAINGYEELYDDLQKEWKGFSTEFWRNSKPS